MSDSDWQQLRGQFSISETSDLVKAEQFFEAIQDILKSKDGRKQQKHPEASTTGIKVSGRRICIAPLFPELEVWEDCVRDSKALLLFPARPQIFLIKIKPISFKANNKPHC